MASVSRNTTSDDGTTGVEERVDGCRHDHSADGCERGERSGTRIAQFAADQLALDLECDHEEEEGHREVVDPTAQVEVEVDEFADV
jgi:hypothetical protein